MMNNINHKQKKVGILGGTFDPMHIGHIMLGKIALDQFDLDEIMILPAGRPPHKDQSGITQPYQRLGMVEQVAKHESNFVVSDLEIARESMTYTIDTIKQLQEESPDTRFYYLIGSDTLMSLDKWKDYKEIISRIEFINFVRFDRTVGDDERYVRQTFPEFKQQFRFSAFHVPDISSTQIRKRVTQKLNLVGYVPDYLADYIKKENLYQNPMYSFETIQQQLQEKLSKKRFRHTLGVVDMAEELAKIHGVSVMEARWAGLLHDCAKEMVDEFSQYAPYHLHEYQEMRQYSPKLLHAPIGAEVAREQYHMDDKAILQAISYHTTGNPAMTDLDKVVYLADAIEVNRKPSELLDETRKIAFQNLDDAMLFLLNDSMKLLMKKNAFIHQTTLETRNAFWKKTKQVREH